ncbi:patatin-like phospholipase family protein [Motiliproteus coralliicola]|uniref:Patatin-like phospholipase family protein n=1 Tax=Motiliproteus coralliicola TaxID=2283196 RepID=A0A369WUI0_9GAMM|nr:patatin-like phospholipase family protein [Motiliproteus coralliicola]RDE24196.1 patatin-like phospholipase family protein [Motiliproteus coralliicola]
MREKIDVLFRRVRGTQIEQPCEPVKRALILSGGGARAAYQVGVLKALAQILPADAPNPFPIICGTSAGAINALSLACHTGNFSEAVSDLEQIWQNLTPSQIYRADLWSLIRGGTRLAASLFNEGVGRHQPLALLDNRPLRQLIEDRIQFNQIDIGIAQGQLEAVSVTAMGYSSGESVSFYQGSTQIDSWKRHRRNGCACKLRADHLMASSAIPTIFPTVHINREYFGDGALRQLAPISPALHLGAERVFVIGVSGNRNPQHWIRRRRTRHSPSMAQIMGHLLASAFIDSLEGDIERLERINELIDLVEPDKRAEQGLPLKKVDSLIISPTKELDKIAGRKIRYLPRTLRFFMRAVGATAKGGGATAASYLLFAQPFCQELIDLGYKDTMWERDSIERFFSDPCPLPSNEAPKKSELVTSNP